MVTKNQDGILKKSCKISTETSPSLDFSTYQKNKETDTKFCRKHKNKTEKTGSKFIWKHYVEVVRKTRKVILTNHLQKITNQTKNQPSILYQTLNQTKILVLSIFELKSTILFFNNILSKNNEKPQK
jgi:hypothetical protein